MIEIIKILFYVCYAKLKNIMKIKNLTIIGIIIAIFVFIVSIYINFNLVVNVRSYTDQNLNHVEEMKENQLRLDVTLNQWLDVKTGLSTRALQPIQTKTTKLIQAMERHIHLFEFSLKDMNRVSLNRHQKAIDELQSMLIDLTTRLDELSLSISNEDVDQASLVYTNITNQVDAVKVRYDEMNKVVVRDLSLLINFAFALILFVLAILVFGMIRFVYFQIPYMVKSLTNLADKHYHQSLKRPKPFFIEEKNIHGYIDNLFEENRFIEDVRDVLINQYLVEDAMDQLFPLLKERMGIDRIGLAFIDYTRDVIIAEYGVLDGGPLILGPGFELPLKYTSLSELVENNQPRISNDLETTLQSRPNSASLKLLLQEGIQSNLILPMTMGKTVFGFLFLSSRQKYHFTFKHQTLGEKIIYEIKGLINRAYFTNIVFNKITNGFSELVEKKDNETGEHILRMVQYSSLLARQLYAKQLPDYPITERMIMEIERSASVHDIGKVGIPDAILKKPGKLTDDEWVIMRTHPTIGADIFKSIRNGLKAFDPELYRVSEEITRSHHERWNGTGYPQGLKGHEIPLVARIVTIADVFDAITSKRVYKDAFDLDASFDLLESMKGKELDPILVDIFLNSREEIMNIYLKSIQ